ncbi:hypothetical protein [Nitratireductor rhodophyticola]
MEPQETYLGAAQYRRVIRMLTWALNSSQPARAARNELHIAGFTNRPGLLDALLAVEPSPVSGRIDDCSVKLCLGEAGNVWPVSIRDEAA